MKDLESQGKVRKFKIKGYDRQSSENLFILFKRGKGVHSHEIVKGKDLLPWGTNVFL